MRNEGGERRDERCKMRDERCEMRDVRDKSKCRTHFRDERLGIRNAG